MEFEVKTENVRILWDMNIQFSDEPRDWTQTTRHYSRRHGQQRLTESQVAEMSE